MLHNVFLILFCFIFLTSCKSNPHKVESLQTELDQSVGLKSGEIVVTNAAQISEKLRDLQNGVYALEDRVYGTRKLGSLGLYGELKSCQRKLASPQFGGTGTMVWSEPLDRVTDKEEELVAVSEEHLKDRLQRFQSYRSILQKRADEFSEKIMACKAEVASKAMDDNQPNKVMISEVPKTSVDRMAINQYMCGYVKVGASLQEFMLNAFERGWLALSDYKVTTNLIAVSLKDAKGVSKDNALLFNGWRLAFDRSQVTVSELFNESQDAKLLAWAYSEKKDVANSSACLAAADGQWNP